ncbi:hypothetical protein EDI_013740 [Entamoeba dispar SAW760]|uniref:Uncharacterized protein n=1 Tax=Entamoeba dispar (strain ATCC PRA-260 / SAW760) TaxID=370354 RepID=B0E5Q8_ENTDS|nr:uncharacterized protein EDI_013740 [Entamoeba dispar SAW760]EDR30154.1 hypothetical protein EDI_013740 [Entamoeba dispar SAW760]|eukprot:EDR30154.1 hypothetical protein EDI_013740 [Entamoeba dispar SAW760]
MQTDPFSSSINEDRFTTQNLQNAQENYSQEYMSSTYYDGQFVIKPVEQPNTQIYNYNLSAQEIGSKGDSPILQNQPSEEVSGNCCGEDILQNIEVIQKLINEFKICFASRGEALTQKIFSLMLKVLSEMVSVINGIRSQEYPSSILFNETGSSEKTEFIEDDYSSSEKTELTTDNQTNNSSNDTTTEEANDIDDTTNDDELSDDSIKSTSTNTKISKHKAIASVPTKTLKDSFNVIAPIRMKKVAEMISKKEPQELFCYSTADKTIKNKEVRKQIINAMTSGNDISLFILSEHTCVATFSRKKAVANDDWNQDEMFRLYQFMRNDKECSLVLENDEKKSYNFCGDSHGDILRVYCAFSITETLDINFRPDDEDFDLPYEVVSGDEGVKDVKSLEGNSTEHREKIKQILIVKWVDSKQSSNK